ncbi:hypothetical protein [Devosia sp.]|uniref:hypothetical protein n=1 Tax=Devosia sp. TaxID=1871048 RepID=UPI003BAB3E28
MAYKFGRIALSVLLLASVSTGTAQAASLLGVNIGGGSGINADVSIGGGGGSGSGGSGGSSGSNSNSFIDVDLLGGDGNLADVNIGGGAIEADVNLLGDSLLDATLIADLGLDVSIGVGIGGGGGGGGQPGVPGGPIGGPNGAGAYGAAGFQVACSLQDGRRVLVLASQTSVTPGAIAAWQRSANVRIVPVKLCTATRAQVAQLLRSSEKVMMLRNAVDRDALISASLDRSSYRSSNVFAVDRSGGQLTVYVL